jgi:hypothetical protein
MEIRVAQATDPFFRHNDAGAHVSVAVTGTAKHPQIAQNLLHNK